MSQRADLPIPLNMLPKHSDEAQIDAPPTPSVAVLLTCFNRREKTIETLRSLQHQSARIERSMHIILVDDGSCDGTAEAVLEHFPSTELIRGSGSLFWNGGMRVAFERAQEIGFDYYLFLNDDTVLVPHCFDTLLETERRLAAGDVHAIVAASICDPSTGRRSYGGMRRLLGWNGVRDIRLEPDPQIALPCDTMNGNCVLIPRSVANRLGNLDRGYTQQFGDYDYGFRAKQAGLAVYIAPGYLGTCANNPLVGTWRDGNASIHTRWKHLFTQKGIPPREWLLFSRRHYGYLWPLYFLSPYVKVLLAILKGPA